MRLTRRSSLADVAMSAGDALRRAGIRGVITGGACAHLYSGGVHLSNDVDIVLAGDVGIAALDAAMATIGFRRQRGRYVHPGLTFFVEFPAGPLGVGNDLRIRPVVHARGTRRALILSATDSCRDRLAAFYHWNDRQSLAVAVEIARRQRVDRRRVARWSRDEGFVGRYEEFMAELSPPGARRSARRTSR